MQRSACAPEKCVAAHVDAFLIAKEQEAGANGVGMSRLYTLRLHLTDFTEWLGGDTPVERISSQDILSYRAYLLKQVSENKWSRTTVSDRLSSVKTFVRWLWQIEAIASLPRVLDPRSKLLEIGKSVRQIVTFTESEIGTLLTNASERTELYILLSLNTAMTQKDIADLVHEEVDWEQGRIIRQRSKTRRSRNVPTVNYKLWSETLVLLLKHRSGAMTGRVLLNEGGEPLLREGTSASGKYQKMDNVRNAFDRLRKKQKITKPFKSLKKTSASLLRGQAQFQSVVGLFLGHAPQKISEKFYAADPQQLLDDAIAWLRGHYVEHRCFCSESLSQNGNDASQLP
jgi:integrase